MSTFKQLHHKDVFTAVGTDDVDSNQFPSERLGEYRSASYNSGEAIFQFCEVTNSKVTPGEVLAYRDSDASTYKVGALATASGVARAAGVVYTSASVGDGVWVQKKGPNLKAVNTDNNVSADSTVVLDSGNAGRVENGNALGDNHGTTLQGDSSSTLAQGEVILDFPLR